MTTAATSLLGLALPVTGELAGTWGDTVNDSITSLLDTAVAGTTTLSTDGDVTLSTTTLAANQARQAILLCSGARTALRTITAPAQSKIYTIINATTGGYSVKLVGAGPTTGVTVVAGESALVAWNGSDFIKISNTGGAASFTNVTVSGTTTLSGLTASTALALDASKNVVSVTNTGTGNNVLSASPTLTGTIGAAALTLSSDLTLSGGTANGVLYLNGSKVATSGSALTFDGQYVSIGAGASSPNGIKFLANGGGLAANLTVNHSTGEIQNFANTNYFQTWYANNSEQMRLTSTGLGLGTSSPGGKLEVYSGASGSTAFTNGANLIVQNSGAVGMSLLAPDANACRIYFGTASNNRNGLIYSDYNGGSQTLIFGVGSGASAATEKMRLDSSGNLGLGVTPSAWSAGKAIEVGYKGCAIWSASAVENRFQANAYYNGGWIYASNGAASNYHLTGGQHEWFIAASGNAGDPITFTQAMTLDASGNLGVGLTTQNERLRIGSSSAAQARMTIEYNGSALTYFGSYSGINGSGNATDTMLASTGVLAFAAGGTTERARITSGGDLLVNKTTTSQSTAGTILYGGGSNNAAYFTGTGAEAVYVNRETSDGTVIDIRRSASTVGTISVTTTATAYNTSSDYRLKDNPQPLTGSGAFIDALQPKTWDWKTDGSKGVGFIAHEVQEVSPGSVVGTKDAVDAEGKPVMQAMEYGSAEFIANIIAEIQSLRKRLADAGIA